MSDVSNLVQRIRGEFSASEEKLKQFQTQQVEQHHARQDRQARLEQIFNELRDVWQPRLEALAQEFGDRLQVTPTVTPGLRQASFDVKSPLATIHLKFAASANADVTELVLNYDLDILPILMKFERHAEIAFPLEQVDSAKLGQWLDDRILSFVKTYLELHSNQYYLKDQMVDDPVAHVRFPKFAAGAKRERNGVTHYFISEATAVEFDRQK